MTFYQTEGSIMKKFVLTMLLVVASSLFVVNGFAADPFVKNGAMDCLGSHPPKARFCPKHKPNVFSHGYDSSSCFEYVAVKGAHIMGQNVSWGTIYMAEVAASSASLCSHEGSWCAHQPWGNAAVCKADYNNCVRSQNKFKSDCM